MKFLNNKRFFAILTMALFASAFSAMAQDDKSERVSPPATASGEVGDTEIIIDYSQPSVKGRDVFGGLEPYGEVWRTGANEATIFEVENDVLIEGQPLPAGKYALFTIPREDEEWTIIFNKTAEQWGAYDYDPAQDALRVMVAPVTGAEHTEQLTFDVDESGEVVMKWADTQLSFDVEEQ